MKDWNEWVGTKYGLLTVEKVMAGLEAGKKTNFKNYFLCRCECGNTKIVEVWSFSRGDTKCCGNSDCKKKTWKVNYPLPNGGDHKYAEWENLKRNGSVIEERINPKYFCKAVAPECVISTLLHICCCECDRPCKRCENTPQKCGARERK